MSTNLLDRSLRIQIAQAAVRIGLSPELAALATQTEYRPQVELKSSVVPDDVTIQCPQGVEIAYEVSHDGEHWVHLDTSRGGRYLRLRVTNRAPRPVFVEVAFPVNPRTPTWYRRSHLAPRSNARWTPGEDQELRKTLSRYTKARLSTIASWKVDKFQRTTAAVVARLNLIKKGLV